MAISQKFMDQVVSLSKRGTELAAKVQDLAVESIKAAYANADNDKAQFLIDNVPKYMQKSIAQWFKRFGLDVLNPSAGQARYMVTGVIDQKRQAKVFESAPNTPVMVVEHTIAKERKPKELQGTAEDRAHKAMQSVISRMKETDPEACALLNDMYATMHYTSVLFDAQGHKIDLYDDEVKWAVEKLTERRLTARLAA